MKIFQKINFLIYQSIDKLENQKINVINWLVTFLSIVFLRNFFDVFSTGRNLILSSSWPFFFLHSLTFYVFTFLLAIIIVYFLTKEKIEKITKISLGLALLILLPPLLDLAVFGGRYLSIMYTDWPAKSGLDILRTLYQYIFFGPKGIFYFGQSLNLANFPDYFSHSYGMRIEFDLIFISIVSYVFLKTRSILKTFLSLLFSYVIFFIPTHFPYFFTVLLGLPNSSASFHNVSKLNPGFEWNYILFGLYFILIFILSLIWFYIYNKTKLFALIKNLRIFRIGLYLGALYYGIYLAKPTFSFSFFDWLIIVLASLAVVFSWLFAVGSNDLVDEPADKINKPERPLTSGSFSRSEVKSLNVVFRIVSYICALVAGYTFFITILVRSAVSYLYSHLPFRLKKIPLVSTFCIASGVLLGVMGGYLLLSSNTIFNFPVKLIWLILVVFTLSMNVIHIKDYQGDKKDQVWTLPVIFGPERGKKIVGWLAAVSFLMPPLIYFEHFRILIIPSIICAGLSYYLINRQNFKEWPVLLLYCLYTVPVALYLY